MGTKSFINKKKRLLEYKKKIDNFWKKKKKNTHHFWNLLETKYSNINKEKGKKNTEWQQGGERAQGEPYPRHCPRQLKGTVITVLYSFTLPFLHQATFPCRYF